MRVVLVDAGPLAALLDRGDPSHAATVEAISRFRGRIQTIWPALTEASHVLSRRSHAAVSALLDAVGQGAVAIAPLDAEDALPIQKILQRFSDQNLDLTDAALTRIIERDGVETLMTLDERDFRVVERAYKGRFKLVVPKAR